MGGRRAAIQQRALIGRGAELADLYDLLDSVRMGHAGLAIVSGEAGIGKTRLLDEAAKAARDSGFYVAWGRSWEYGSTPALWPWLQVLRELLSTDHGRLAMERSGAAGRVVEKMSTGAETAGAALELGERFTVFASIATFLRELQREREVLLVFDDIHAADDGSNELVLFIARDLKAARLGLLVTYRSGAAGTERLQLGDLAREGFQLELDGLDEPELAELVADVSGSDIPPSTASRLKALTGGNPLLALELGRTARRDPTILQIAEGMPLPQTVHYTVGRRLEHLPPQALSVAQTAAVIGRDVDRALLEEVADVADVSPAVESMVGEGLIRPSAPTLDNFVFAHDLIRQVLYDSIPEGDRAAIHLRIAEALRSQDPLGERKADAAHHLILARDRAPDDLVVETCGIAGDEAANRCGYADAARFYEIALSRCDKTSRTAIDLMTRLAAALMKDGQRGRGAKIGLEAAAMAKRLDDPVRRARALVTLSAANRFSTGSPDPAHVSGLKEALPELGEGNHALRSQVMAALAVETLNEGGRVEMATAALGLARASGDLPALLLALRAMGAAGIDRTAEAMDAADELLRIALREGLLEEELRARSRRCNYLIERGDVVALDEEIHHLNEAADRVGHPLHLWLARTTQATRAMIAGDVDGVERLVNEAFELTQAIEHPNALPIWFVGTFYITTQRGDLSTLESMLASVVEEHPSLLSPRACYALIAAEHGRMEDARARLAPVMNLVPELAPGTTWLPTMFWSAWAAARIGDEAWCTILYDRLLPYEDLHAYINAGVPSYYGGCIADYLGMLAGRLGRADAVIRHYSRALDIYSAIGAVLHRGWGSHNFARSLIECGEVDHPRIPPLIEQAIQIGRDLGVENLVEAAARLAQHAAAPPAPTGISLVLHRRGDYWSLESGGEAVRLRDVKGLHYIALLLAHPGREFHVLDLMQNVGDMPISPETARHEDLRQSDGDMGPMLDPRAKAAYKRRIAELQQDIDEATLDSDIGRKERAERELEALVQQLSAAAGLGGRDRKWATDVEKARVAVQKSIRRALDRIGAVDAALGRALEASIETGVYCSFKPIGVDRVVVR